MLLVALLLDYTTGLKKGQASDRSDLDRCFRPGMVDGFVTAGGGGNTWGFEGTLRNPEGPSDIRASLTLVALSDAYEHFQMGALADL